jgi:uncharacterized protein
MSIISVRKVNFEVGAERLVGNIIGPDRHAKPTVLFLHGAGQSSKERSNYLAVELAKRGISSFAFDFSGQGESSGRMKDSSLFKRVGEAREALSFLNLGEGITVVGSSMGAHVALELIPTTKIKCLLLFCPAVYDKRAFFLPFDRDFSKILRSQESWRNTKVFGLLKNFAGSLMIVIGEEDNVIPKAVIQSLESNALNATYKKTIWIPGASHQIHLWLSDRPDYVGYIVRKLVGLI